MISSYFSKTGKKERSKVNNSKSLERRGKKEERKKERKKEPIISS